MKKTILLGILIIMSLAFALSANAININNCSDLLSVNSSCSETYTLTTDISGSCVTSPLCPGGFTGTFDGQGYTITGLNMNLPTTTFVGLFSKLNTSSIVENLGLIDVDIVGNLNVGSLAGRNAGDILNCYATGTLTGSSSSVGGLVGINPGNVNNSYATANVTGGDTIGGLVAFNDGLILNSYATGTVISDSDAGGLVGFNLGNVNNSYATGKVTGSMFVGGLIGYGSGDDVTNSYWHDNAGDDVDSCIQDSSPCSGEEDLSYFQGDVNQALGPFDEWDFSTPIWYEWTSPVDHPKLEAVASTFTPPTQTENTDGTDLSTYNEGTIQSVSNYEWYVSGTAKVAWSQALNLSAVPGSNLDDIVETGAEFFSVDTTTFPEMNKPATITFYGVDCSQCNGGNIVYSTGTYSTKSAVQGDGKTCASTGKCFNFACTGGTGNCSFDVTGFTSYAYGANANLTIYDGEDPEGGDNFYYDAPGFNNVPFYANYTNSTGHISGATCLITFDSWSTNATMSPCTTCPGDANYYYNKTFTAGIYSYDIRCDHASYTQLETDDSVSVIVGSASAIPEFSDYAIILIVLTAIGGFFVVKKKKGI